MPTRPEPSARVFTALRMAATQAWPLVAMSSWLPVRPFTSTTFAGRPGLYLEDLYVRPAHRGGGYGAALLRYLAQRALARGCARFEWSVLDWNELALGFYRSIGARPMTGWTGYRLDGDALAAFGRIED